MHKQPRTGVLVTSRVRFFQKRILVWGRRNGRDYPWRHTRDAFLILIAELMLRRTRADQVAPVYKRFVSLYPDAAALVAAPEEAVAALVWPLGLAWRAPTFRQLACVLVDRFDGRPPRDRAALLALPGVGDYVASAVRRFAFDDMDPLIDTNTVRVAGRYFGLPTHAESRRNRVVRVAVAELFDPTHPRDSGLALLDFAGLVCRARQPDCAVCPVSIHCCWFADHAGHDAPPLPDSAPGPYS